MLKAAASKVRHVSASIHTARGAHDVGKPCTVSVGNHHIRLAGVLQIQSIVLILASQAQLIITDAQQLSTGSNCCACKQDYRLRLRSLGPADRLRLRAAGAGEALPLGEPTGLARRGERLLGGLSSRLQTYRSNSSNSDGSRHHDPTMPTCCLCLKQRQASLATEQADAAFKYHGLRAEYNSRKGRFPTLRLGLLAVRDARVLVSGCLHGVWVGCRHAALVGCHPGAWEGCQHDAWEGCRHACGVGCRHACEVGCVSVCAGCSPGALVGCGGQQKHSSPWFNAQGAVMAHSSCRKLSMISSQLAKATATWSD
jgi:hypothetical protein